MGNTTIEINGKRYNARTGELLGDIPQAPVTHALKHAARQSRTVDGFARSAKAQAAHASAQTIVTTKSVQPKPHKKRASMSDIKHVAAHKPQHSQTLMRKVVKKPVVAKKTSIKPQAPSELAAAPKSAVAVPSHKLAAHHLDERRLTRARTHEQSKQITRFTNAQQNHPAANQRRQIASARQAQIHRVAAQSSQPSITRPARPAPARAPRMQTQQHAQANADPSTIFEAAIANARSHEQPKHKTKRKAGHRLVQMASFVVAFIAIGGFVAYLNMPNIELHMASSRAGFHASLPSYKPTGYALDGGVHASNGIVSVSFKSGDSKYTVQQQESNWDSQTLLDNVVSMASSDHKTYKSQGRTVYIYGDNAAWVNGGVLYSMKVDGSLSHQQIVSVATSM